MSAPPQVDPINDEKLLTGGSLRDNGNAMGFIDRDALKSATPRDLLVAYEEILIELRRREIVRTNDVPLGQWAEWCAHQVLHRELARNSSKSHDLVTPDGRRVQIRARLVRELKRKGERLLSVFRSFDFEDCLILLFAPDYTVRRTVLLSVEVAQTQAQFRDYVRGWGLFATEEILQLGTDLSQRLK